MKAAVISQHGGLEVFDVQDVEAPTPAADEVLVDVHAAALNHLDIWIRKGRPGLELQFPHTLGADAAGIVLEVGERVTHVAPGDEVVINPGISCNTCEYCLRGQHSECASFTIQGMGRPGTFAERVTVPGLNVYRKPRHLNWEEAAALPLAYLTAWRMLFSRARVLPGETVLIHGIGGGVALAALQLGVLAGARCIVTSSDEEKLSKAEELGAAEFILYSGETPVGQTVLDLTGGRGADVIVDAVGAATWPINLECARKGGRIVHCGVTTGASVEANLSAIYWRQLSILGSTMGSQEEFRQLLAAAEASELHPVVDSIFSLDEARPAQERMEHGLQFGKIVLHVE